MTRAYIFEYWNFHLLDNTHRHTLTFEFISVRLILAGLLSELSKHVRFKAGLADSKLCSGLWPATVTDAGDTFVFAPLGLSKVMERTAVLEGRGLATDRGRTGV